MTTSKTPRTPATPFGIGERLRAARAARRKTMAEVAEGAGVTKGFLSRLERDQANASVAVLMRLCGVLDLPVSSLFEPAPAGTVLRRGEYPVINFGGNALTEYMLTPRGEHRVSVILGEIEPGGGAGDEHYSLPGDVEFAMVLEGDLRLTFDNEPRVVELQAGDAFTFHPGEKHTFRATGDGCRVLWVFSPGLSDIPPRRGA